MLPTPNRVTRDHPSVVARPEPFHRTVSRVVAGCARSTGTHATRRPIELCKPKTVDATRLESLIHNPRWGMQQKYDGVRCVVACTSGRVSAANRNSEPFRWGRNQIDAITNEFPTDTDYILDGELAWERFYAFDELSQPNDPYKVRLARATALVESWNRRHIRPVPTWYTTTNKRAAFQAIHDQAIEGVILRRLDAPHTPGHNAEATVRYKCLQSADVILAGRNGTKASVCMAVRNGGGEVRVGSVTVLGRALWAAIEPGMVAEVRYLYATEYDQLFQPCIVRLRDDKPACDCTLDQLVRPNKGEMADVV